MDDTEVRVVDEAGNELPPGQVGEIAARGPRLMLGYWKAPEATARTIDKGGWLHTGDMGWMDEDGYFYLAGRATDMIIRGGENISPEEVEAVLCSHPSIEDAAVIGVPDEEWGERVRAVVVLKRGEKATDEEIIEFCRARLASYKKPESVVFVDRLLYSPLGKVLKREIREQYGKPSPKP
jgi:acyl-CoA synthetase (AMP-forming)/AMP-acid ligase II